MLTLWSLLNSHAELVSCCAGLPIQDFLIPADQVAQLQAQVSLPQPAMGLPASLVQSQPASLARLAWSCSRPGLLCTGALHFIKLQAGLACQLLRKTGPLAYSVHQHLASRSDVWDLRAYQAWSQVLSVNCCDLE